MKIIVSSTDLLKQLSYMKGLPASKSTLPIIKNFLLVASGKKLTIIATDLDTTVSASMPVEVKEKGSVALPAAMLMKALRFMRGQHLTFVVDKGSKARITSDTGTYEIVGYPAGEYPKTPVVKGAVKYGFPASVLSGAINKTLWAAGNDDLRPVMAGVLFEFTKKRSRFVATDAHRLVIQTYTGVKQPQDGSFIVRTKAASVLAGYMKDTSGDVEVLADDFYASFHFNGVDVMCRLVDGKYPRYEAVIPAELPNTITVDRTVFLQCVRRLEVFSSEYTHQVKFIANKDGVTLSSEDLDSTASAKERLQCSYQGDPLCIGFNARYLVDILKNMTCEQVVMRMDKPNMAAIIEPVKAQEGETITTLVMPVMLND